MLIVFLGLGGYFGSGWILDANAVNQWIYIPPGLLSPSFASWLPQGVFLRIAVGLLVIIFGYAILSFVYAVLFPIRLGETDEPPMSSLDRRKL
jgi:hypothetical protein